MHKVLKAFPYAPDGIHIVVLAEGEERDFGSCTPGLEAAGYIAPLKVSKALPPTETAVQTDFAPSAAPVAEHVENAASDAQNHVADASKPKRKR